MSSERDGRRAERRGDVRRKALSRSAAAKDAMYSGMKRMRRQCRKGEEEGEGEREREERGKRERERERG